MRELRLVVYALTIAVIVLGGTSAKLYLDLEALLASYGELKRSYELLVRERDSLESSYWTLRSQHNVLLWKELVAVDEHRRLQLEHDALRSKFDALLGNYTSLEGAYRQLKQAYEAVQARLAEVESGYRRLQLEHDALRSKFDALLGNYTSLEGAYRQLLRNHEDLLYNYSRLRNLYDNLVKKYEDLGEKYYSLASKYNDLMMSFSSLENQLRSLQAEYSSLKSQYSALQLQYNSLIEVSVKINASLASVVMALLRYCCVPFAFERVLNLDEVRAVGDYVMKAGVSAKDVWASIQNIYGWVRGSVKYAQGIALPFPTRPHCDKSTRLCYYQEIVEIKSYVQRPSLTASLGMGDSDDQAVLVYAMIKHYLIYVHGVEYDLWMAQLMMGDGSWHLAVFLPVSGGSLTVIDTAGGYLTTTDLGKITARPAYEELVRYSDHWSSRKGISFITLFRVNVATGTYFQLAGGDLSTIASYISSTSR